MVNIKLVIEYDGTHYFGFQRQKRHITIQQVLEKALSQLCNEPIKVIASGRTDSGVHAKGHVVNFKTSSQLKLSNIVRGLNAILPDDIAARSARFVSPDFHARFSAVGKVYQYTIWNSCKRSPLKKRYNYHYILPLNIMHMKKAARILIGKHDFKAFSSKSIVKDTVRTLRRLRISQKGSLITFTFEGDGFLYNMVRTIVGTLLLVGRGKLSVYDVRTILTSNDRTKAGPTVPSHGLTLIKVLYHM